MKNEKDLLVLLIFFLFGDIFFKNIHISLKKIFFVTFRSLVLYYIVSQIITREVSIVKFCVCRGEWGKFAHPFFKAVIFFGTKIIDSTEILTLCLVK